MTCKGIDIIDNKKPMFLLARLCLEIRAVIWKSEEYLTFNACLEAGVKAESPLRLDAEYSKAIKSAPKGKLPDKVGKGKGEARNDSVEGWSFQGALQRLRGGSRSGNCCCGHGGHGRGGYCPL
jgi:hypothetical protein